MVVFTGCSSTKKLPDDSVVSNMSGNEAAPTDFHDASTWLLGYFTRQMMTRPPHSEWFQKEYDKYLFNAETVNKLTMLGAEGVTIKIVMGSWCPDSRREVPRFMKVLDFWKFPVESITFIGVDDSKFGPVAGYDKLDIQRVPTFIFYKNNIEAGRIIENPVTSLEQDMVDILTKE